MSVSAQIVAFFRRVTARLWQACDCAGLTTWAGAALLLVCAVELFWMQWVTLNPPNWSTWKFNLIAPTMRLGLDFCFWAMLLLLLRKWALAVVFVLVLVVHLGLYTYHDYYLRALSLFTLLSQWREGWAVADYAATIVPRFALIGSSGAFVIKCLLLCVWKRPMFARRPLLPAVGLCVAGYAALFFFGVVFDPLQDVMSRRGVSRMGVIRGYSGAWFAEWYYLADKNLLDEAIRQAQVTSDQLTPIETKLNIPGRLIVLQIESLGYEMMGYSVAGKEVMPFLNRLRDESMFYRVRSLRRHGSADADFVMLAGKMPSERVLNYALPAFPYGDAWPHQLDALGYQTLAVMGASGQFYRRRDAFEQMGFDRICFAEELHQQFSMPMGSLGVRDSESFAVSSLLLRESPEKTFLFMATITTHGPFDSLRDDEKQIFPGSRDLTENAFNCYRYADDVLRNFLSSLPARTVVAMYGDHTSGVTYGDYRSDMDARGEYVPFYIYEVGRNLSEVQRTRGLPTALDGSLNVLDMATYLRNCVVESNATKPKESAAAVTVPESPISDSLVSSSDDFPAFVPGPDVRGSVSSSH